MVPNAIPVRELGAAWTVSLAQGRDCRKVFPVLWICCNQVRRVSCVWGRAWTLDDNFYPFSPLSALPCSSLWQSLLLFPGLTLPSTRSGFVDFSPSIFHWCLSNYRDNRSKINSFRSFWNILRHKTSCTGPSPGFTHPPLCFWHLPIVKNAG